MPKKYYECYFYILKENIRLIVLNVSILNFMCYWYLITISSNYEKELVVDVKSFIKKIK